jgi:hypothetical protein
MIVSQLDSLLGLKLVAQDDTLAEFVETVRRLGPTRRRCWSGSAPSSSS